MDKIYTYILSVVCALLATSDLYAQRTVTYDLYVNDTLVNYTGKSQKALAINGQIPAPTLYFTEGDTAVIRVHNRMDEPTSIHWHGILVPTIQDGVPYLTSAPAAPHSTHTKTRLSTPNFRIPPKPSGKCTPWTANSTSPPEMTLLSTATTDAWN